MGSDNIWPARHVGEAYAVGADWAPRLEGATISGTPTAVLLSGSVDINQAPPVGFNPVVGSVQNVWLSGGAPGLVRVMLTIETSDGRTLQEVYALRVL